jgi:GntR family transcriptional regulator
MSTNFVKGVAGYVVMTVGQPLYRTLADTLRSAIVQGRYSQGALLPTELELCEAHNVSRHTARDALRLLCDEGLIARKRGAGTRVIATQPTGPFSQEWGDIAAILQYARDTKLVLSHYGPAGAQEVEEMGLDRHLAWMMIRGVRQRLDGGPTLALTTICVRANLMPTRAIVENWPHALGEYITQNNGVRAVRIDQDITAVRLDKTTAKALGERAGDPALRTLRRYQDEQGDVFLASISVHPGDRFAYRMAVER